MKNSKVAPRPSLKKNSEITKNYLKTKKYHNHGLRTHRRLDPDVRNIYIGALVRITLDVQNIDIGALAGITLHSLIFHLANKEQQRLACLVNGVPFSITLIIS